MQIVPWTWKGVRKDSELDEVLGRRLCSAKFRFRRIALDVSDLTSQPGNSLMCVTSLIQESCL